MKCLKPFAYILLLVGFISCEKEISSNFDQTAPQIVLNSIIYPDSLFTVYLSESLNADESFFNNQNEIGYKSIDNAIVSLYDGNDFISELQHTNDGRYIGESFPDLDHQYSIKTSANGFPVVITETALPVKIPIDSVKLIEKIEGEDVFYNLHMRLFFTDPPGDNYYYLVVLYNELKFNNSNFVKINIFTSNDPVFATHIDQKQYYIFNDNLYDNQSYSLDFSVTTETNYTGPTDTIQYYYYLCSLNDDYYKYLDSYNKVVATTDPDNNPLPLSEPVQFYNNIENGFGVFGGMQVAVDSMLYIK
jgi:hypothetical protein